MKLARGMEISNIERQGTSKTWRGMDPDEQICHGCC
jgi:hypothetical protein